MAHSENNSGNHLQLFSRPSTPYPAVQALSPYWSRLASLGGDIFRGRVCQFLQSHRGLPVHRQQPQPHEQSRASGLYRQCPQYDHARVYYPV